MWSELNKMKTKRILWFGIVILFIISVITLWVKYGMYTNYWKTTGYTYDDVIEKFGEPNEIVNDGYYDRLYYEGREVWCLESGSQSVYLTIVEDETIKLGVFNIGVGSPRNTVEAVYFFKKHLIVEDENSFAIEDWGFYITFEYDENDMVKKMYISFQG